MPKVRRRFPDRRTDFAELTSAQEYELATGWPAIRPRGGPVRINSPMAGFRGNRADLEAAWGLHRERMLKAWVAVSPGTRPFAWWLLDHGKERPIIRGNATPEMIDSDRRGTYGFLHTHALVGPLSDWGPWQEPEEDYLRRHNLLTAAEEAALAARASSTN